MTENVKYKVSTFSFLFLFCLTVFNYPTTSPNSGIAVNINMFKTHYYTVHFTTSIILYSFYLKLNLSRYTEPIHIMYCTYYCCNI